MHLVPPGPRTCTALREREGGRARFFGTTHVGWSMSTPEAQDPHHHNLKVEWRHGPHRNSYTLLPNPYTFLPCISNVVEQ